MFTGYKNPLPKMNNPIFLFILIQKQELKHSHLFGDRLLLSCPKALCVSKISKPLLLNFLIAVEKPSTLNLIIIIFIV